MQIKILIIGLLFNINLLDANAQDSQSTLSASQKSMISISALTAKGDLAQLKKALAAGLDSGLSISKIKESIVHTYA